MVRCGLTDKWRYRDVETRVSRGVRSSGGVGEWCREGVSGRCQVSPDCGLRGYALVRGAETCRERGAYTETRADCPRWSRGVGRFAHAEGLWGYVIWRYVAGGHGRGGHNGGTSPIQVRT
jgi:hypothetical protein